MYMYVCMYVCVDMCQQLRRSEQGDPVISITLSALRKRGGPSVSTYYVIYVLSNMCMYVCMIYVGGPPLPCELGEY